MDSEDLKQWWLNLFKKNICKWDLVLLSHHIKHNGENRILNKYHMSEVNYFKILLLCEMMWHVILNGCWCGMVWLDTDVDILYAKRIGLNDT
jgi:hypothetical protein